MPLTTSSASSRPAFHTNDNSSSASCNAPSEIVRLPVDEVRVSMARIITAWGFGAAFVNLSSSAVYTAYTRQLGANDFLFGLLAAAMPLMSFLQILTARLLERTGQRKRQMLLSGLAARALWMIGALVPLMQTWWPQLIAREYVLPIFAGCILGASALQAFTSPAFFAWLADLVPARVRPTFLAQRMQTGTLVAIVVALGSGYIADNYGSLQVYGTILVFAGLAGFLDIAMFLGVKEPPSSHTPLNNSNGDGASSTEEATRPSLLSSMQEPLRDPAVRNFLKFVITTMFAFGLFGPFLWLHMLEFLKYSKTVTGLVLNVTPLLGIALTSRFWGGFIKKHGSKPVMQLASAVLLVVPLGCIAATPHSWWLLAFLMLLSGIFFGGLELCHQNLITDLAPQVPRSTMTALFSICAGCSFALASCLGGRIALWLSGMEWHIFQYTFINYHVLFALSLLVRLYNTLVNAPRLQDPSATGTIEAVKEVVPEVAQSIAAWLTRPFTAR